jgi:hypothetical protein
MRRGVTVFAWQPIEEGQEITVDYRLNAFDDDERWACVCGSESCTGEVVGSFFSLPPGTQEAYLPHAPPFMRREYRRRSARPRARCVRSGASLGEAAEDAPTIEAG